VIDVGASSRVVLSSGSARAHPADLSGSAASGMPAVGTTTDRPEHHGSLQTAKED
jgi:hypothetical protein